LKNWWWLPFWGATLYTRVGGSKVKVTSPINASFDVCAAESACVALTDMPPRSEHELDPVTLHNQALMNMEQSPTEGFEKLQFLIQQNPFPPETFPNLLLLYVKYEVGEISVISYASLRANFFRSCYCLLFLEDILPFFPEIVASMRYT